jgi:hypothetical protein
VGAGQLPRDVQRARAARRRGRGADARWAAAGWCTSSAGLPTASATCSSHCSAKRIPCRGPPLGTITRTAHREALSTVRGPPITCGPPKPRKAVEVGRFVLQMCPENRIAGMTARAGNRRKGRLSALRAHTKAPYKMHFHSKNPKER